MAGITSRLCSCAPAGLLHLPAASTHLPPCPFRTVTALVREVFAHAAGEGAVEAVSAFLRRQHLTSLSDFEFLELAWLQQELGGPQRLPPLLLNKFLQLGRKRGAAGVAGTGSGTHFAASPSAAAAPKEEQPPS